MTCFRGESLQGKVKMTFLFIPFSQTPLAKNIQHTKVPYYGVKVLAAQSCPTLCDPVDCSPSGSFVGIQHSPFSVRRGPTMVTEAVWFCGSCLLAELRPSVAQVTRLMLTAVVACGGS